MKIPIAVYVFVVIVELTRVQSTVLPRKGIEYDYKSSFPFLEKDDSEETSSQSSEHESYDSVLYSELIGSSSENISSSNIFKSSDSRLKSSAKDSSSSATVTAFVEDNPVTSSTISENSTKAAKVNDNSDGKTTNSTKGIDGNHESSEENDGVDRVIVNGMHEADNSTFPQKSIFQKSLEWVEDAYTLSILIPIAAGVVFASTIIVTCAICRCCRKACRRRRYRKNILPESIKSLRPSDRARLLGESSDEEF